MVIYTDYACFHHPADHLDDHFGQDVRLLPLLPGYRLTKREEGWKGPNLISAPNNLTQKLLGTCQTTVTDANVLNVKPMPADKV